MLWAPTRHQADDPSPHGFPAAGPDRGVWCELGCRQAMLLQGKHTMLGSARKVLQTYVLFDFKQYMANKWHYKAVSKIRVSSNIETFYAEKKIFQAFY